MQGSTISFDNAVELLAESKALSPVEAQGAIHAAISDDGVKIHDGKGGIFHWNDGPGRVTHRNYAPNSEFNVFEVGNGWSDFDSSASPPRQKSSSYYGNSGPSRSSKQFGLDETWTYDRANLAAAIKRIFEWDVDFVTRKNETPEGVPKGGAPAKEFWKELEEALATKLRDDGLPASKAAVPSELINWAQLWLQARGKQASDASLETHIRPILVAFRTMLSP